jgi:hypothetical protein
MILYAKLCCRLNNQLLINKWNSTAEIPTVAFKTSVRVFLLIVIEETAKIGLQCSPFFSLLSSKRKVRLMRSPICLSVCSPLITFEPIGRYLWNSVGRSCHWRWPRRRTFYSRTFNHSKMVDVQTSEMDATLAPVNVRTWNFVHW